MSPHYKLTYFNVRGLAEHIRFMFIAAGVEFEDVRVDWTKWSELKPKSKGGQLPVLEVDGKELSQSLAIARFLSRKLEKFGIQDAFVEAKANEIIDFLTELRLEFRQWFLTSEGKVAEKEELKQVLLTATCPKYLGILEGLAEELQVKGHKFIGGEDPTWYDFFVANWMEIFGDTLLGDNFLNKYPTLKGIKENVFTLPAISAYVKTRQKTIV